MVKKFFISLLSFAMIGTLVGCGSKANTVSDEDLQMLREMRDELKAENDNLKAQLDINSTVSTKEVEQSEVITSEEKESEKNDDSVQNENILQLKMLVSYVDVNRIYELSFIFNNNGKEIIIKDVLDRGRTFVDEREVPGNQTYTLPASFKEFYDSKIFGEQAKIDELYLDACEYYSKTGVCDYEQHIDFFPKEFTLKCDEKEFVFHTKDAVVKSTNISHLNKNAKGESPVPFYYRNEANNDREIVCEIQVVANVESEDIQDFTNYVTSVVEWYINDETVNKESPDKNEVGKPTDGINTFDGTWSEKGDDSYVFTLEGGTGRLHSAYSGDCDITYTYDGSKVFYMETNFGTVEYYYYPDKDLLCRDSDGAEFYRN